MRGQSPLETKKLEKNRVLLVEGQDDERFFIELLKHLDIPDVQVWDCGSKDNIANVIMRVSKDALLPDLKTLIVTRDADENPDSAFESVCGALVRNGFVAPSSKNSFSAGIPKVGVFLLAGSSSIGMLEDLCLETVQNHPAMACVQKFCECVTVLDEKPKNRAKSEAQSFLAMQSFLAAMPRFVRHVGEAAQKGYWNFEAETLRELREFLLHLREE